jgi:hypothetical protein
LCLQALALRGVGISEVARVQVDSWPASHEVGDDLHDALLLEGVADVFVALHVELDQLDFTELEFGFHDDHVGKDL